MEERNNIFNTALAYKKAGLDVIPDHPTEKYPIGFSDWQKRAFTEEELKDCIVNKSWGIGVRNQEGLDFDNNGNPGAKEILEKWGKLVEATSSGLVAKLLIEETQHKGYHVAWKCKVIEGNQKLASRLPTKEELQKDPKLRSITFIETRGLGGQFVASPTPGYRLLQGDWCSLPQITPEERAVLLQCAKSLDFIPATTEDFKTSKSDFDGDRPGDLFNQRGVEESLELLKKEDWKPVFEHDNAIYLRRPGKDKGISATFGYIAPGIFYNLSRNASPFEPNKAYTPFAVFTLLKHDGDFSSAASELAKRYQASPNSHNSLISQVEWPSQLAPEAFYGLAGDTIKTIEPHTEADPAALLANFLTAFGSIIGDSAYIQVEAVKHPMRLFIALVGKTSKGRKGTSWGYIENLFRSVDENWAGNIASGMSSGEGLIWAVRDEIVKIKNGEEVVDDPGIEDKRLLVIETEFSSTLKRFKQEGNTLSPIIRSAWDTGNLRSLTKNSPAKATGAHISIITHTTTEDLHRYLADTECANGFGNRFLWICTKRSKVLPFGGKISQIDFNSLVNRLHDAVTFAKTAGRIDWDESTKPLWEHIYFELSDGKPGIVGALTGRSEAYVTRLAGIYALLDHSALIKPIHLEAALAFWDYAEASVKFIFQNNTGDSLSDQILGFLNDSSDGLNLTQINNLLFRHVSSDDLSKALGRLKLLGLAGSREVSTQGRKATVWFAIRREAAN